MKIEKKSCIIYIEEKINFSKGQDNYIELKNQYRMTCAQETVQWIDLLTKELKIDKLHLSKKNKKEQNLKLDSSKGYEEEYNQKSYQYCQFSRGLITIQMIIK